MKVLVFLFLLGVASGENQSSTIIEANNYFTPDLYKEIIKDESGNLIFSPLSAGTVLALLHSGCEEETAKQLAQTLHLPDDKKLIQTEEKNLLSRLQNNRQVAFNIANALFVQNGLKIEDTFLKVATDDFYALSQNIDFTKTTEAVNIINKWVENKTHNSIKNLVTPDDVTSATKLVLLNALRFKGNWLHEFFPSYTRKENFYKTPNDVVKVDTLHLYREFFKYYNSKSLKAEFLEMPFQNENFAMLFILPGSEISLLDLEKRASEVFDVRIPLEWTLLNVALSKFKFESRVDLKEPLQNLGAGIIFDMDEADLSGISGQNDLFVDKVIQKAFIDLNEEGVEASAATAVVLLESANDGEPKNFIVNRPFMFCIKYKNVIIFAGRVIDPEH